MVDGDASGKSLDEGAQSALHHQDLTSGIHEAGHQPRAVGETTTGDGTSVFSKDGAIGSLFNADGAIGSKAQAVGGPFDKTGAIGRHFNADGSIGGTIQENLANKK